MEELNKKLAEWAFRKEACDLPHPCDCHYVADDKVFFGTYDLPDFTSSLDACFKWLVPKLDNVVMLSRFPTQGFWTAKIGATIQARDNNSALALCLAIKKLIDKEDKEL